MNLSKIIQTFLNKLGASALGFLVVIITARYLGAECRGEISLLLLCISINCLASSLVGSSVLTYLTPRYPLYQLLIASMIWGLLSVTVVTFFQFLIGVLAIDSLFHVWMLSLLLSFASNHNSILQGYERIRAMNGLNLAQVLIVAIGLFLYVFVGQGRAIEGYIASLYLSYGLIFLLSLYLILQHPLHPREARYSTILKAFFRFGSFAVLANIAQLLNYRFSFFIIDKEIGLAELGIYSIAVTLAESVWLITKSISAIQYARIVNLEDVQAVRHTTNESIRISFIGTGLAAFLLLLMPSEVFVWVFGADFKDLKYILLPLLPGIVALGISNPIAHYFSGIGKQSLSAMSSLIGLGCTIALNLLLIPSLGLQGAAIAASVAYSAGLLFLWVKYRKEKA